MVDSSGYPKRTEKASGGHETRLSSIAPSRKLISVALLTAIAGRSVVQTSFETFCVRLHVRCFAEDYRLY